MIDFKSEYSKAEFLSFLRDFLPDFESSDENIEINKKFKYLKSLNKIGQSNTLGVKVFEIDHESENDPRVSLSKESFILMRELSVNRALIIFKNNKSQNYRFSLITFESKWDEGTKIKTEFSNPRRYSFFLGPNAKTKTPSQFLINSGQVKDFVDLKNRFSIEVVNKEFYKEISGSFTKLVEGLLKLPDSNDKSQTNLEFAVRLIGRIIFCWFLKEKKNSNNIPLIPKELLSLEAINKHEDYYHNILEAIFFEILNMPIKDRIDKFREDPYSKIPYLNGGLFSPEKDDFYRRGVYQSDFYNNLQIPDEWLKEFFTILETYNFTIDENTSYDEELSIDPEMLGRIFENLLAQINPETGESARKSTGSYYTPRIIVDYMVDESLLLYLKQQTEIDEEKLKAVISYELTDDDDNPITLEEREKIVNALERVKILDPACGSGAFPIGALQKIVFILQQVDPDGDLWFKKQLAKASPEFRRDIEKKFSNKEFDFLRKLGVIRECIYGVDIQPIATEISRLRCFLTLIVDEHIDDGEENRGIKPLPNLDFKFVTANSLIGLPKLETNIEQPSLLPDNKEDIDELKNIRDRYFTSSGIEREQLKTAFAEQQNILIKQFFRDYNHVGSLKNDFMQKITDWKPFTHQATDWFEPEWMFGIKEGFDIVIANPPYIRSRNIAQQDRKMFSKIFRSAFRTFDIYLFFIERSLNILNSKGRLNFIIPYPFLNQPYASKMRKIILEENSIDEIADLSPIKIFDGAEVKNCLIFLKKGLNSRSSIKITKISQSNISYLFTLSQSDFHENPGYMFKLEYVGKAKILAKKIEEDSIKLGEIMYISKGIEVYERNSGKKKGEFIHQENNGSYKPYIEAKEISRYVIRWSGKFLDYQPQRHCSAKFPELFENKKILVKRIIGDRGLSSAIDYDYLYAENTLICCLLKKDLKDVIQLSNEDIELSEKYNLEFIVGILNSSLLSFYFKTKLGDSMQIYNYALETLPIKITSIEKQKLIVNLVNNIQTNTKSVDYFKKHTQLKEYEKQIDQIVYNLYGLTKEEIEIVENN